MKKIILFLVTMICMIGFTNSVVEVKMERSNFNDITKKSKAPSGMTFIGDSIMHSSKQYIKPNFDNPYFDTKIGRQFSTLPGIVRALKEKNQLGPVLIVHLGTNGPFKDKDFDDVMAMAEGRPVFFINAVMPDSWEAEVNRKLAKKVSEYPNARLFDWYGYSKKQTQYFYKDRTHLKDAGQKYYADFVTKNINDYFNKLEEKNTDSVNDNTLNQEKSTKLENVKIQNIVK